jgi:hypothetical protein
MISLAKFREAQRLLARGDVSQRKIAATVGISRATVGAIANGKCDDREAREHARADRYLPTGLMERCGGCGGRVYLPCLLCRVRSMRMDEQKILRAGRRNARQQALRRLLSAVREAHLQSEAEANALRRAG